MFPYRDQAPLQNLCFFFFNDTATTEIYTLSLHDALPISPHHLDGLRLRVLSAAGLFPRTLRCRVRSEEHTSELQSHLNLVCRLLLEKKKKSVNVESQPLASRCMRYSDP